MGQGNAVGGEFGGYFKKTFLWESEAEASSEAVVSQLTNSLRASFGLKHYERSFKQDESLMLNAFEEMVPHGKVSFKEIFKENKGEEEAVRPVKLEICSGTGEWVVSQARADPGSDWVSLEWRRDRVYNTFTRMVFESVANLAVMDGDASKALIFTK